MTFPFTVGLVYWVNTTTHFKPNQPINFQSVPTELPNTGPSNSTGTSSTGGCPACTSSGNQIPTGNSTASAATIVPKHSTGYIAGIGVLAAFLVFSIVGLLLLLHRRKKLSHLPTSPKLESHEIPPTNQTANFDTRGKHLLSAISVRRRPGPDDDSLTERAVFSRFNQLENSITTFALTYFQNIPGEVRAKDKELAVLVPSYGALLKERRTAFLVVRAVIARVLAKEGFGLEGKFLGEGWKGLMGVLGEKGKITATVEEFDDWRVQAFSLLESSPDWLTERNQAIANLTTRVSNILSPLVPPSTDLLTYLNQVVETTSQLAIDLVKQRSRYEVIMFDNVDAGGLLFDPTSMEDVWQESTTEVGPDGTLVNELSGREVRVVVFPLVVKRSGEKSTVISKAKVLV
ncbi:MAG: hypothetical protein M1839_002179 [Geoglossum umbratile]|nr:MAG: hypothetical protein M1839_002179 [Geoglossum umbratile]